MIAGMHRRCPRCRRWLPLDADHFRRNRSEPGGFAYRCKACLRGGGPPRYRPKGIGQRAYALRLAGQPWRAIAVTVGLRDWAAAMDYARIYRRRHGLPGFRAARAAGGTDADVAGGTGDGTGR